MNIIKGIADALFPEGYTCLICGGELFNGEDFCTDCEKMITLNDGATCPVCGRRTKFNQICLECKDQAPLFDKAVSALVYEKGVQTLILGYKKKASYLRTYFARQLYKKCVKFTDVDGVCFVPMTERAFRNRGYNQAELLAFDLSELLSLPLLKKAVEKVKESSPQKSLTRAERANNLKGCFRANRQVVQGKTLIVVDDVLTTGATAEAICKELKKKGAKKIYYATAASVEYKEPLI